MQVLTEFLTQLLHVLSKILSQFLYIFALLSQILSQILHVLAQIGDAPVDVLGSGGRLGGLGVWRRFLHGVSLGEYTVGD